MRDFLDSQVLESKWESNGHLNLSQGKWRARCLCVKSRDTIENPSHVEKYRSFLARETVLTLSSGSRLAGESS